MDFCDIHTYIHTDRQTSLFLHPHPHSYDISTQNARRCRRLFSLFPSPTPTLIRARADEAVLASFFPFSSIYNLFFRDSPGPYWVFTHTHTHTKHIRIPIRARADEGVLAAHPKLHPGVFYSHTLDRVMRDGGARQGNIIISQSVGRSGV